MKSLKALVRKLDISKTEIIFRFRNDIYHKTFIGGVLSVLLLIAGVVMFYVFGADMFNKQNPSVLTDTIVDIDNGTLNLNDPFFNMIIQPSYIDPKDPNSVASYIYNASIISILVQKATYTLYSNGTKVDTFEDLEIKQCDINNFDKAHQSFFNINGFGSTMPGYCLKDKNLVIQGQYSSPVFSFVKVTVAPCNGVNSITGEQVVCEDLNKIKADIGNWKVGMFFTYAIPLYKNYSNPYSAQVYTVGYNFGSTAYSKDNYYFSTDEIITDDSWFFSSNNDMSSFKFTDFITTQTGSATDETAFLKVYVRVNPSYTSTSRIYKKIPDILAQVLSIVQVLHFVILLLLRFYNRISLNASIINHCFLDEGVKGELIIHSLYEYKKSCQQTLTSHLYNNFISEVKYNKEFINEISPHYTPSKNNNERNEMNSEINPIRNLAKSNTNTYVHQTKYLKRKFGACLIMFKCLSKKNNKRYHIGKTLSDRLDKKMEVDTYLHNLDEMKYLKEICLSPMQLDLFKVLSDHPVLKYNNEEVTEWLREEKRDDNEIIESMKTFYGKPSDQFSEKDKVLYSLLNKKLS